MHASVHPGPPNNCVDYGHRAAASVPAAASDANAMFSTALSAPRTAADENSEEAQLGVLALFECIDMADHSLDFFIF